MADTRHQQPDGSPQPERSRDQEGISPLNPETMPRAEDDRETFAHSPEYHDRPDPGPNVGRPATNIGDAPGGARPDAVGRAGSTIVQDEITTGVPLEGDETDVVDRKVP